MIWEEQRHWLGVVTKNLQEPHETGCTLQRSRRAKRLETGAASPLRRSSLWTRPSSLTVTRKVPSEEKRRARTVLASEKFQVCNKRREGTSQATTSFPLPAARV